MTTRYTSLVSLILDTWSGTTHAVAPFGWVGAIIIMGGAFAMGAAFILWRIRHSGIFPILVGAIASLSGLIVGAGQAWIDYFDAGMYRDSLVQASYWSCVLVWALAASQILTLISLKDEDPVEIQTIPQWALTTAKVISDGGMGLLYLGWLCLWLAPTEEGWWWHAAGVLLLIGGIVRIFKVAGRAQTDAKSISQQVEPNQQ